MGERTGTLAPLIYYRMDVHTLSTFLSPILTVASVWNTGETGDMFNAFGRKQKGCIVRVECTLYTRAH